MEDKKALIEVYEVLKYLSEEDYNKIPEDLILAIEKNKDNNYNWKYDENKSLLEQNLSRSAIIILSYINMEYLLNDDQKDYMKKLHEYNEQKAEEEKRKKYNIDNIFKISENKNNYVSDSQDKQLIEYEEKKWYKKILLKILKIIKH